MTFPSTPAQPPAHPFDTACVHAGIGSADGEPLLTPLTASTTFCRDGVGSNPPHQYSRVSNPTVAALETTLGELESAPPAVAYGSGLAAIAGLLLAVVGQGDHVVCSRSAYGGTVRLLHQVLPGLGVETTFVDATDNASIRGAITPRTKLVFLETPANPTLEITDIRGAAAIAHEAGALVAVDNTFQTPILQQPLELGADVSVYSTTKFIEGHSAAVGGSLTTRDGTLLERLRFIRKCTGAIQNPFNAWETLKGLKTLPLRIRRQSATAADIAEWLAKRGEVSAVFHPSVLPAGRQRELAEAQHLGGARERHGAVVSFDLAGGVGATKAFCRALTLCRLVEHVGSSETLITNPATMTHGDVPVEQREAVGITDGLLRLSVGLEDPADIIADLERGLRAASAATEIARVDGECEPCLTSV